LIKEEECDVWFSIIREDIKEVELQSTHSHNTGIKDMLINMLDKSMHNLQTNDYEDTDSTTYQKLAELSELIKGLYPTSPA